jgi:hypothetical protein
MNIDTPGRFLKNSLLLHFMEISNSVQREAAGRTDGEKFLTDRLQECGRAYSN